MDTVSGGLKSPFTAQKERVDNISIVNLQSPN